MASRDLPRFHALGQFLRAPRACGDLTRELGQPLASRDRVRIAYACGVVFERWVTLKMSERDVLPSALTAFPKLDARGCSFIGRARNHFSATGPWSFASSLGSKTHTHQVLGFDA